MTINQVIDIKNLMQEEMNTNINILKDEFNYIHDYHPIEHDEIHDWEFGIRKFLFSSYQAFFYWRKLNKGIEIKLFHS